MAVKDDYLTRLKRILEKGYQRSQDDYNKKKDLVKKIIKSILGINSKLKNSQLGPTVSDFLEKTKGNEDFSDYVLFLSNVNTFFTKKFLGIRKKFSKEEGDFLWILHKKDFKNKNFEHYELVRLYALLGKEQVFVGKSIIFLNGLIGKTNKEIDDYIKKSLPFIILLGKVIEKQKEALDNGNITSFLEYFKESDKINIQSYSQFQRRKFLAYGAAGIAVASALAMEYSDLGRMLGLFEKPAYGKIPVKGINYDVGTRYTPDFITRQELTKPLMEQEIKLIKNDLNCNAIRIYGEDINRLVGCATIALDTGLQVWVSPRFINLTERETIKKLLEFTKYAENLRKLAPDKIILVVGNEFTLDIQGFIPGGTYQERGAYLGRGYSINHEELNRFLKQLVDSVRGIFNGPITYAAGDWEEKVDWYMFDLISVNKYLNRWNKRNYIEKLRKLNEYGNKNNKLVAITEFGCSSYKGAEDEGGSSPNIVDWGKGKLNKDYKRDENVQANYILDLLKIFLKERVYATFVYTFIESHYPYREGGSRENLDTASFNVIKVVEGKYGTPEYYADIRKRDSIFRKKSFDFISNFYKNH